MEASDLTRILRENPPSGEFTPYHFLSKEADALTIYFRGDRDYSKRLTDHVTLLLSCETHEIVGCRIKGIAGILEDLPNYLHVNHEGLTLSLLFLPFRGAAEETREVLNQLAREAKDMRLQEAESGCA